MIIDNDKKNATFLLNKPDVTYDVSNGNIPEEIMTEDESPLSDHNSKVLLKTNAKKPIFSPFNNSPVKKRVEAFERLCTPGVSTKIPSKIRNLRKKDEKTPITKSNSHSSLWEKSSSTVKSTQKENEALIKKKALIQAEVEEKKRKREEKQHKVQLLREEEERKKKALLEEQVRKNNEKARLLQMEKEEKIKKMRIEVEKKRALAAKKAKEMKIKAANEQEKFVSKTEEKPAFKLLDTKDAMAKAAKVQNKFASCEEERPVYMLMDPPLLPVNDCYDSDDERKTQEIRIPEWASSKTFIFFFLILWRWDEKFPTFFHKFLQDAGIKT